MKTLYQLFYIMSCILLLLINKQLPAQDNWVATGNNIPVNEYQGHRFRFHGYVKTELEDDSAAARLWARVDLKNGMGYLENMRYRPIRSKEWNYYTVEGSIDSGAYNLVFGVLCQFNGKFYFDDFNLEIEIQKGKWFTAFTSDFERDMDDWTQKVQKTNYYFTAAIFHGMAAQGKSCLLIEGKNVPVYGINTKVGNYAEVNGIKLYYEIYGEGYPLIVLHGNGGSIQDATIHYPELIKKYKVIAIDSRCQGKSTDADQELTYEQMASDINALLEKLQIDSAFIWGQSDGAILGLILAMDYPKKVKKLLAFGSNIQHDSISLFPWAIKLFEKNSKVSLDSRTRKLNSLMCKHPDIPYSKLSKIKAPVLIMAGDRDVIRPEHTLKLFQNIPNSHLCIIPGATHFAAWEKKDLFLQLLEDFFDNSFTMPSTESFF